MTLVPTLVRSCPLVLLLLLHPAPAEAIEYRVGRHVIVGADEVIDDDVYLLGETITINGTITGDVTAHALLVTINGVVGGDLLVCGPSVLVNGRVADDLRFGGWMLTLGERARVGDDVLAGGFRLATDPGSSVGGTFLAAGYSAHLAGSVVEDVVAEFAAIEVPGTVGGRVLAGLERDDEPRKPRPLEAPLLPSLGELLALLVTGYLLQRLAPGWKRRLESELAQRPFGSFVCGVGTLFGVLATALAAFAVVVVMGLATAFMAPPSFVMLAAGVGVLSGGAMVAGLTSLALLVAPVIVGSLLGQRLLHQLSESGHGPEFAPLVVGVVFIWLAQAIPYLGPLVAASVALLGLGAASLRSYDAVRAYRAGRP